MEQVIMGCPAQKPPFHALPAAVTVADVMRPPLTTVDRHDHVAAAAYLMKHAGTTALVVADARTGQPTGIITESDVAHAIADGKNVNDVRVNAVMAARPAVTTTTSIRDAAKIMTTTHFRHLPVASGVGVLGVVDITDVCRTLAGEPVLSLRRPIGARAGAGGRTGPPRSARYSRRPARRPPGTTAQQQSDRQ